MCDIPNFPSNHHTNMHSPSNTHNNPDRSSKHPFYSNEPCYDHHIPNNPYKSRNNNYHPTNLSNHNNYADTPRSNHNNCYFHSSNPDIPRKPIYIHTTPNYPNIRNNNIPNQTKHCYLITLDITIIILSTILITRIT